MQLYPVKGSRFYIGAAVYSIPNEDVDSADFTSVVWTQVKGWSQMGDITDSQAEITESVIDLGRDLSTKGTFNAPRQNHRFIPIGDDAGQLAMRAAAQTNYNYPMKVEWDDAPPSRSNAATITIAAPGVITWTAHGLTVNQPVKFSSTGALPTGLVAGTVYYVKTAPDANTFTVAPTVGGTAITTTGTQSGVHTAIALGTPSIDQWIGLVFPGTRAGGQANTARMVAFDVKPNTNILSVDPVIA